MILLNCTSNSIFPASFLSNCLIILPLLSTIALTPLFVDLNKKVSFSIALKIDFANVDQVLLSPNHPSSEMLIIRLVSDFDFCIKCKNNLVTNHRKNI